jgi:hypothetical protein
MTRVAKENQDLQTTFLDLEKADEEEINGAIRSNTKVNLLLGFSSTLLNFCVHSLYG